MADDESDSDANPSLKIAQPVAFENRDYLSPSCDQELWADMMAHASISQKTVIRRELAAETLANLNGFMTAIKAMPDLGYDIANIHALKSALHAESISDVVYWKPEHELALHDMGRPQQPHISITLTEQEFDRALADLKSIQDKRYVPNRTISQMVKGERWSLELMLDGLDKIHALNTELNNWQSIEKPDPDGPSPKSSSPTRRNFSKTA